MSSQAALTPIQRRKLNHLLQFNFWTIDWDFLQLAVPTTAGTNGTFKLANDNTLDAASLVIGFNFVRQNNAATIYSHTGNKLVNQAVHDSSFLVLSRKSNAVSINKMPLVLLEPRDAENPMMRRFPNFVSLAGSYIECVNPTALVTDEEYAMNVYYISLTNLQCILDQYDCSPC